MKKIKLWALALMLVFLITVLFPMAGFAQTIDPEEAKQKIKKGTVLLKKIESSLKGQESESQELKTHIKSLKLKINENRERVKTLKGQLFNLQSLLEESQQKHLAIREQLALRENELLILRDLMKQKQKEKEKAMEKLARLSLPRTRLLEQDGFGLLSFFIATKGLSEELQGNLFFDAATEEKNRLKDLDRIERELLATQKKLIEKHETFQWLREKLEGEIRNIQYHQEAKKRLLVMTKGEEKIYQDLLEEAKKEQENVNEIIRNLKENRTFVEGKLRLLTEDEFLQKEFSISDFEEGLRALPLKTRAPLKWPVSPIRGISAHFQDEAYRKAMGIPHNAIDIRIPQGSRVKAAMTGVVLRVRDSDIGYNYVILAHREGLLTLYGHLMEVQVKEGETVFSGETIGLSGGIPGTRGAGWLTTGAHLHFEVFKDWKHVDPLEYLPLEFLPIEYVPEKYVPKLLGEEDKVKRLPERKVRREIREEALKE